VGHDEGVVVVEGEQNGVSTRVGAIGAAVAVARAYVEQESWILPSSLFSVVLRLHDEIFGMSEWPTLQNELSELCELWHQQNRSAREAVAPQMLTYLLARCLANDSKLVDVKRLNAVREGLLLFEWEDESAAQLRIMVQRTFLHAQFLSSDEGKKFLVWTLSRLPLISVLHKTLKTALVSCPKWKVLAYAHLYFKAWQKSEGAQKLRLESLALQDLVNAALHLQNPTTLKTVKQILQYIVDQKSKDKQVEDLLHRLYSPFIFRALQVANPAVRENALYQLGIVFPLVPPTLPQGEFDETLQDQFHLLVDALDDPAPNARSQAVLSVGRILAVFWEILPTQSLHTILNFLINDIAFDKASPLVREAVFKILTAIIESSPASHRFFSEKGLLAKLRPLIFDVSEKVRLACVALLKQVKTVKVLKFYDIVDFDTLLNALATEKAPKIQSAIASVLQTSYWPINRHPVDEIVSRAIGLISTSPDAAVAFYSNAKMKDPIVAADFIIQLWNRVLKPTLRALNASEAEQSAKKQETERAKKSSSASDTKKLRSKHQSREETDDIMEESMPDAKRTKEKEAPLEATPENLEAILQIVEAIWSKIEPKLKDRAVIQKLLTIFDDETMVRLQALVPHRSVTSIASRLPPNVLERFSRGIVDTVCDCKLALANGNLSPVQKTLLPCIFAWEDQYANSLLEVVIENLEKGSNAYKTQALRILENILASDLAWMRDAFLALPVLETTVLDSLHVFRIEAEALIKNRESDMKEEVIVEGLALRLRLLMHMAYHNPDSHTERMIFAFEEAATWTEEKILPFLQNKTRDDELDLEVEAEAPSEIRLAISLATTFILVFSDYDALFARRASAETENKSKFASSADLEVKFDHLLWKLVEQTLKVRSDATSLGIVTAVGWKLLSRVATTNASTAEQRAMLTLLLLVRDPSLRKRSSVSTLKLLGAKPNSETTETILSHLFSAIQAQLPDGDLSYEIDLEEALPAELEAILSVYTGSTKMLQTLANWLSKKLEREGCLFNPQNAAREEALEESRPPAPLWTSLQITALALRPQRRLNSVKVQSLQALMTKLFGSMREADENEAILRSRFDQLLKSPAFASTKNAASKD
jgi:condensin-2 complex subunit G2